MHVLLKCYPEPEVEAGTRVVFVSEVLNSAPCFENLPFFMVALEFCATVSREMASYMGR